MGFFCGVLSLDGGETNFNELRRICNYQGAGCAYVSRDFSVLYAGDRKIFDKPLQPITRYHNGHPYTAVAISSEYHSDNTDLAGNILGKYFEEGDGCLSGIDLSFAALIYDGRCGELLACRSGGGDIPLFYAKKDGKIYFSTVLPPLYKLFGGCVRVNKRALEEYIGGEAQLLPADLFCDIRPIYSGKGVFCTRFGESEIDIHTSQYSLHPYGALIGVAPQRSYSGNIEAALTDTLLAFGYPQFDCYMPSFMGEARRANSERLRAIRIQDATFSEREYSAQRAYVLSELCGARIIAVDTRASLITRRAMRLMEKRIDKLLDEYIGDSSCVLYSVLGERYEDLIGGKKSIPSRIRRKGMLCQTVMWFEHFNIVAV